MWPVSHGSRMGRSARTAWMSGTSTRSRTFVAMLFPSIWHNSLGRAHASARMLEGGRPWARQVSVRVALRTLLPIHGGCFLAWSKQGKCRMALRPPCLALEICSSAIQSSAPRSSVSWRRAMVLMQSAAAGGNRCSTRCHCGAGRGLSLPSISANVSGSVAFPSSTCGASLQMSALTPHM